MRPKKYLTMNGDLLIDHCPETDGIRSVSIELCNQQERVGLITCLQNTYSINSSTSTGQECVKMNLRHGDGRTEGATNKKRRGDKFEARLTLGKGRNNGWVCGSKKCIFFLNKTERPKEKWEGREKQEREREETRKTRKREGGTGWATSKWSVRRRLSDCCIRRTWSGHHSHSRRLVLFYQRVNNHIKGQRWHISVWQFCNWVL